MTRFAIRLGSCAILALAAALPSTSVLAVDVACISFVGDRIGVIEQESSSSTGTNTPKRRGGATSDISKDDVVAKAALVGLTARNATMEVITLKLSGAAVAPLQAMTLSSPDDPRAQTIGPLAAQLARQADAKNVLVFMKLEFRHWSSPYVLSGIGVFGDGTMVRREDNYVAPYVGTAMLLFDAAGKLRERRAIIAHAEYHASLEHWERSQSPWEILPDADLDRKLDELIVQQVSAAAAALSFQH